MIVISKNYTYKWNVKVSMPVAPDTFEEHEFTAIFKRLGKSKIQELTEAEGANDKDLAKAVLAGWDNVTDDAGAQVEFTPENIEELLDIPMVASAVVIAFMESVAGAKRKN